MSRVSCCWIETKGYIREALTLHVLHTLQPLTRESHPVNKQDNDLY